MGVITVGPARVGEVEQPCNLYSSYLFLLLRQELA